MKLIKTNKAFWIILFIYISFPSFTSAKTLEVCKLAADNTSKLLPIKKDKFTYLTKVGCIPGKTRHTFTYVHEIRDIPLGEARLIDFSKEIKPKSLNQFCTDPSMRALLNAFDIDHRYYASNGIFIGSFLMRFHECRN